MRMYENILESDRAQITVWCMEIACWIPLVTHTHTHSQYVILASFHCNNGCTNAAQYYVTGTLPVLYPLCIPVAVLRDHKE